jgi:hypothetical protein
MKLGSLVIRTIFAWMPILPPPPLIARQQREASPTGAPVHVLVIAEGSCGTEVSVINRELLIVMQHSGG